MLEEFTSPFDCEILNSFLSETIKLGIENNTYDNISIYPNPADDFVYVKSDWGDDLSLNISIYNYLGELQLSKTFQTGTEMINIERFTPGIYLVVVNQGGKTFSQKMIVK